MKVIFAALAVLIGAAFGFALVALVLWLLVPLAFPLLAFTYWQALALTGIIVIIGLPALKN